MVLVSATALVKKYLIDLNKVFKKVDIKDTDPLAVSSCFHVLSGCTGCSVLMGPLLVCSEGLCPCKVSRRERLMDEIEK